MTGPQSEGPQQEQPANIREEQQSPPQSAPRERTGLNFPSIPRSFPEFLAMLTPERSARPTKVPLSEVMTFEHQTGLYHNDTLRHERMWLTISPIVSFVNSFARRHFAETPVVRGSAVRHAAFIAHDLDTMRDRLDHGEQIEELERFGGEDLAKQNLNEALLLLARSQRDIPSQYLRQAIYPDMVRDFHIDQFDRLRPQDGKEIQSLYYDLFTGPDLDIKLPPMSQQATLLFYQRLFGSVLPQMTSNIATDDFIQRPDQVDGQMRRFAGSFPPELAIDHHVTNLNEDLPINIERIMQAGNLAELSQAVDYTITIPKEVAMRPVWGKRFDQEGRELISSSDLLPELTMSAKLTPIRGGALYVGQIIYGAAYDFRNADGTAERRIQPLFTIDIPTRAPKGQELADARYSTAATNYDYTGVQINIHPASAFKRPLMMDTSEMLEADMVLRPEAKTKFNHAVELGPDWNQTSEPQGLEIATRALWQAIDSRFHDPERDGPYVSPASIDAIKQRISRVGKAELLRECNAPEGQFARVSLQKNLMVMALVSPHDFVQYAGKTGIWDLLFTQGEAPPYQEILADIQSEISSSDYLTHLASRDYPDPSGWQLLNNALVRRPEVQRQLRSLIPDFKPEDWITNMYYLTSLLTSRPR